MINWQITAKLSQKHAIIPQNGKKIPPNGKKLIFHKNLKFPRRPITATPMIAPKSNHQQRIIVFCGKVFGKKFGGLGNWLYLCSRFLGQWRDSSVG